MHEQVFNRIEKKYLITKAQKNRLLKTIKKNTEKDAYYRSEVYNLYFDNDNYDLIAQSIDKPVFKEKLRARSYGGYDRVFLEIKTKLKDENGNIGYKRRIMTTRQEFAEFIQNNITLTDLVERTQSNNKDIQIAREIDHLIQHFSLKPKILITYNRESYKGKDGLRITFDDKLRFRNKKLDFIKGKRDKIYFKDIRNTIMEIKAQGALPLWLVKIMSSEQIYPQQFSKIGKVYTKLKSKERKNV